MAKPDVLDRETITIRDFFVEGNNVLLPEQIDSILAPFIGTERTFADIESARAALEQAYRQLGYPTVAVTVLEQTVEYGVVTLTVYEGRLKAIDITGNRFFSDAYVRDRLPAIRLRALLHEPTVLRQLDTLNAGSDLKIAPVLKSSDDPNQLNLELKVKDRLPLHGKVEFNNRGISTTPRFRLNAALQYTNLFNADHVLTVQTSQTPQDWGAVEVYSGNYVVPLGSPDHQLVFYGATANSRSRLHSTPLPVGGGLDIIGNSVMGGFRYLMPFAESGSAKHQLSVGIDYKHIGRSQTDVPGGGGTITVTNPISYIPAAIGYIGTHQDDWGMTKATAGARGYVSGLMPQGGQKDFGGDIQHDPLERPGLRRGSTGTFVVLQGGLYRYHSLPKGFDFTAKVDGQWGSQPLIPTEQYFAGGLESVRGYREFEAIGDNAAHATVELTTPTLMRVPLSSIEQSHKFDDFYDGVASWIQRPPGGHTASWRFAAFYDTAALWTQHSLPGQTGFRRLEGTGVGVRLTLSEYLRFRYDAAWTLRAGPISPAGSFYGHFSLEAVF